MSKLSFIIALLIAVGSIYCMSKFVTAAVRAMSTVATKYVDGTYSMAFVTVPDEELGRKLAKGLVENKLAACVNIIPGVKSIYEWKGEINEDSELILMIKTRTSRVDEVSKYVRENHQYEVAEVISSPIQNGNPPYLDWIGQTVPEK